MLKHVKRTLAVLAVVAAVGLVWGGMALSDPPPGKGGGKHNPPPLPPPEPASGTIYYWDQEYPHGDLGAVIKMTLVAGEVTSLTPLTDSGVNNAAVVNYWDVSHGNSPRFFIYMVGKRNAPAEGPGLYVSVEQPADFGWQSGWQRKIEGPGTPTGYGEHPAISQDDSKVAFRAYDGDVSKLYVANLLNGDTSGLPTAISEPIAVADVDPGQIPSWSPDGRYIAYGPHTPLGGYGTDIFVVEVYDEDGDLIANPQPVNITNTPDGWEMWPVWSPWQDESETTSRIAFEGIYTVAPDGSDRVLAVSESNTWLPAWSPDGRQLAFKVRKRGGKGGEAVMYSSADGTTRAANLTGFSRDRYVRRIHWRE